ncbi:MAG: ABC transporter ATP-binding protein [Thermoanaerobaculia bacterium]
MIELQNVSKTYKMGDQIIYALKNINLKIEKGDYISIMGPSGSGKSTLLHILGLLDTPTSGDYLFEGKSTRELSDDERSYLRRKHIGFVFQFFYLLPRLNALKNVELPLLLEGIKKNERTQKAIFYLEKVGLSHRIKHKPEELSGGERQRVAIARACVMEPTLLLADEPSGNLDRKSAYEVIELLEKFNSEGKTLIVVTHDQEIAKRANLRLSIRDGSFL